MNNAAKTREFLLIWDVTKANPNGDMLNDNQPRRDETTGLLEVSDVRIKRFIRDYWLACGKRILVREEMDNKGKVLSCQQIVEKDANADDIKYNDKVVDQEFKDWLFDKFIDVRLFGAVVTKPKYNITGPLQVAWSRSLHPAEITVHQGNAAYASGEGKSQSSIWTKYMTPYACFSTHMVFNAQTARLQNIPVTHEDIEEFKTGLIEGLKNYRSTSKNQMPRILVEIIYSDNNISGDLRVLDYAITKDPLAIRDISEITFDLAPLQKYCVHKSDSIEAVHVYIDPNVAITNLQDSWKRDM